MKYEKTTTRKKNKQEYENNLETTRIYKNGEEILPYCILQIGERKGKAVIRSGIHIFEKPTTQIPEDVVEVFTEATKQEKKTTTTKKNKKTEDDKK